MLRAEHVTKTFSNGTRANDAISLTVEPGEVFGLLGPAGSGKTTFAKQLVGLLRPTSGSLRLAGSDLIADPAAARQLCAYQPQGQIPVGSFRVCDAIELTGFIRGASRAQARRDADRILTALGLAEHRKTLVLKLPAGLKRLVGFAMAAVRPGALIVLDDPSNEVDAGQRSLLWTQIRELSQAGAAVLFLTPDAVEAEHLADRLAILSEGRILVEGKPSELTAGNRGRLRLHVTLTPGEAPPPVPDWASDTTIAGDASRSLLDEADAGAAIAWARASVDDGVAQGYELSPATLADLYHRLTTTATIPAAA